MFSLRTIHFFMPQCSPIAFPWRHQNEIQDDVQVCLCKWFRNLKERNVSPIGLFLFYTGWWQTIYLVKCKPPCSESCFFDEYNGLSLARIKYIMDFDHARKITSVGWKFSSLVAKMQDRGFPAGIERTIQRFLRTALTTEQRSAFSRARRQFCTYNDGANGSGSALKCIYSNFRNFPSSQIHGTFSMVECKCQIWHVR